MKKFLVPILCLMFVSCKKEKKKDVVCTTEVKAALNVKVSTVEGRTLIADSIKVIAIDAAFSETLTLVDPNELRFAGAYERAGNYVITVRHPGMSMVTLKDIKVDKDECHVIPRQLDVIIGAK
jgi:hypothetical protein